MRTLETERLVLRKYRESDFEAVHSYASRIENLAYMEWGPNSEEETRGFLNTAIRGYGDKNPNRDYVYAAELKDSGRLIGGCDINVKGDEASLGWILHHDYWKQGYGTEIGKALLKFGFEELGLHRIIATCDAENIGSYRVMEKIGMRREGHFLESRPPNKLSDKKYGNGYLYAILRDEWDTQKEIAYYNALPCVFNGFIDLPELSDGVIYLVCVEKKPGDGKLVPGYNFAVCKAGEKIGAISLRIGYIDNLYYGGQIGYNIDEKHRGNGYAVRACRLLAPVAKAHGMEKLLITNNHTNIASRRVCEKLGARFVRVARLPEWNDLYIAGQRLQNIFEWDLR